MHAMQYEITLPADYDMGIIRHRVATRGHLLDDFPGLGLKAYLIREKRDGSPVNQYAPFYLWSAPEGMNGFLWGPGFQGIVDDFGRPQVDHWTGLTYREGPSATAVPLAAVRHSRPLDPAVSPALAVEHAVDRTERLARLEGVVCAALAIDPRTWELVHFTLWDSAAPREAGDRFEVLHLSQPERAKLPSGRQW